MSYGQAAVRRSKSINKKGGQPRREFISSKKLNTNNPASVRRLSSDDPNQQDEATSQDTPSTYSLPKPPPRYESPSMPSFDRAFRDTSSSRFPTPPTPPMMRSSEYFSTDQQQSMSVVSSVGGTTGTHDDSDYNESGVELSFQPEDDVSTIGFSVAEVSEAPSGAEPDGYKSDDNIYRNPKGRDPSPLKPTPSTKSRKGSTGRQQNRVALTTVDEQSNDTESRSTPITSAESQKEKIDENCD